MPKISLTKPKFLKLIWGELSFLRPFFHGDLSPVAVSWKIAKICQPLPLLYNAVFTSPFALFPKARKVTAGDSLAASHRENSHWLNENS